MISWEEVVKVESKWMLKYWNGSPFRTNSQKDFTHTQSVWSCYHRRWFFTVISCTDIWISIVLCALLSMIIPPTRYSIYMHVKWSLTIFKKGPLFNCFNIKFDMPLSYTQGITLCILYIQINSLYFPTCDF